IQVDVIRTMASRRLRILGSGTRSTFTLYGAHQIAAFIMIESFQGGRRRVWFALRSGEQRTPLIFGVGLALAGAGAVGLADDREDLADLHDPLEVPQVLADDALGVVADQRRDQVPKPPRRRDVVHSDVHL